MTDFDFGDVVLVPFPFTDQTSSKQRPAIVVSSAAYQAAKPDLIIMAVTGQMHQARSSLEAPVTDWKAAGLLKASLVKPVIATIEKSMVVKKLGALAHADRSAIQGLLGAILGAQTK